VEWPRSQCPAEGGKEGLLFVNKKKQKNFMMALRALGLETLPSPPDRRYKADEVFCALFSKKRCLLFYPTSTTTGT
jgi:hypothetical protein